MPMDIEEFEDAPEQSEERTTSERIIEFLYENQESAYTRSEIATAIDQEPNTVGTNLSRLKTQGLVRHKKNHWALTNDLDRLSTALQNSDALERLNVQFGPLIENEEDAKTWADTQPDRPHPSEEATNENQDSEDGEPVDA